MKKRFAIRVTTSLFVLQLAVCGSAFGQRPQVRASSSPPPDESSTSGASTPDASPPAVTPETVAALRQIQHAALESDYAYRQVAHLSNNIGPRLSGSAQAAAAIQYVSEELKKVGCAVTLEKVMVPHWVRGEETAALIEYPDQAPNTSQKIVLCALGASVATPPEGLTAEVVVASTFDEFKTFSRDQVNGKIVLFNHPFDKQMTAENHGFDAYGQAVVYRSDGPVTAARKGAVACLIRSVGGAEYRLPHAGQTRYVDGVQKIPAAAVTAEDADLIANLVKEGPVKMRLVLTPQTLPDAESFNVIGDIKGTEHPEQVVIVSGHLDSWDLGTGAIDDAAGVAVSMETANVINILHLRPRRTIRVIAWINEENGSAGSKRYAADHASDLPNQFAAIETDNGADHPIGVHMRAEPITKLMLAPLAAVLEESGAGILEFTEHAGADVEPLEKAGVPTFAPMQDSRFYFNYHHTAADTLDKVVPKQLAENSAVVAATAYALANLDQRLARHAVAPGASH
jgi:carboxypeptidase Q